MFKLITTRSYGRIRISLAAWFGLSIHRLAALIRKGMIATNRPKPSNIAVICDPFLRYGSAQAAGLANAGLNVTLYFIDRLDDFAGSESDRALFLDRAQAAGVELVSLPRRRMLSLLSHTFWLHRDLRRRNIAIAIVHAHIDPRYATLGLALPVAMMLHDPQTHSGDMLSTHSPMVSLIPRLSELTSACIIIHAERLFDQVRPLLQRLPFGVVPHGTEMASSPAPIPRERNLLVLGRLFEYKGVDTALEAFHRLPENMADVKLVVAGLGPMAALARDKHNVELREEHISDTEIDALIADARLVLLPYKDATQSGIGLQAVAQGVPCVVSRVGGLPDLVQDCSPSLIVAPADSEGLAHAIVTHIDHDDGLRRAIYDHAATHFAWPAAAQRLCSELRRIGLDSVPSVTTMQPHAKELL